MLGGSWVVISGGITIVIIYIRGLITILITTHEPPSVGVVDFWDRESFGPVLWETV